MSLIRNLIKEPEHKPRIKKKGENADGDDDGAEDTPKFRPMVKSASDLQRIRLEKLMKNPDKPIVIPEPRKEKDMMQSVPSFVRNVMGSSAGAGSGEFHVYRHLRRKEYARQKVIQLKSRREELDDEYQLKLEENRRASEAKTAKKRAKRLKRKEKAKRPKEERQSAQAVDLSDKSDSESGDDQQAVDKEPPPADQVDKVEAETTPAKDGTDLNKEATADEDANPIVVIPEPALSAAEEPTAVEAPAEVPATVLAKTQTDETTNAPITAAEEGKEEKLQATSEIVPNVDDAASKEEPSAP